MQYEKASKYVQMRFKRQGMCMICKRRIQDYEIFEYIAVRVGREKLYNFFHTSCLTHSKPGGYISMSEVASQLEEDRSYGRG